MGAVGAGVSSGYAQLSEALRRDLMTWSWASDWDVGASVRAFVSMVIPQRMRSSGITTGVVMVWWRNSTVLDICSVSVLCGMIRWHL